MRRFLLPLLAVVVLLGIWELYVKVSGVSSLLLPSPVDVLRALIDDRGTIWHYFKATAAEICLGLLLGAVLALSVAVALHFSRIFRESSYPLLVASQAIPIPIVAPLLVVWLGFGLLPKLVVVALVSFFPIVVTTLSALETVDPDLIKLMATFDARRVQTFWRVELPSALPGLFAGAKLAAVFSVLAAILAEQAGSSSGAGELLTITESNYELAEAFATVFVLSAFAILLFALLTLAERRALPWAYRLRETEAR